MQISIPTAKDAIAKIKSGDHIFIHGAAATPHHLIEMLVARASELKDVTIYQMHSEGAVDYAKPEFHSSFKVKNFFVGANMRPYIDFENVDYIPCFLSEIGGLFKSDRIKLDYAFIQTSPIDKNGFVSLGTSVDIAKAAVLAAKKVIAEINEEMPRTFGDGLIPLNKINAAVFTNTHLDEVSGPELTEKEHSIGQNISYLIKDGSCLQIGIGAIPNAALRHLGSHKDLGLHSEMCSDGILPLIEKGVINNSRKKVHPGKSVCSFVLGSQRLYMHIDDNPSFFLLEAEYVNNPAVIARNPKMVSINSAVEVDLTGQVCADSIGPKIISGVGGQIDFMRGAALSEFGKAIVAITARTKKATPRIVPFLKEGAGVVTSRAHLHHIVTEYGIADLHGKTLGERAKALIKIAYPDDRENLERIWHDQFIKNKKENKI
ncbi:MAG: acetyl-CoA hydrolase/transferase family protein [Pseudobdellovibrio sp.]